MIVIFCLNFESYWTFNRDAKKLRREVETKYHLFERISILNHRFKNSYPFLDFPTHFLGR